MSCPWSVMVCITRVYLCMVWFGTGMVAPWLCSLAGVLSGRSSARLAIVFVALVSVRCS